MIKKHLKLLIVTSIVTLLPIVAGVILWNRLPARIGIFPARWTDMHPRPLRSSSCRA